MSESLVVIFSYGLYGQAEESTFDKFVFPTRLIVNVSVARLLLLFCLNAVGLSVAYWFQVRLHETFWKVAHCLILQKALQLDHTLQEKTISSLMPQQLATELLDTEFQTKYHLFALHKQQELVDSLKSSRPFTIHHCENVTILFADIVGFTSLSSNMSAEELVGILNEIFSKFDQLAEKNKCEKVCTLGDCYFCVSGCPQPCQSHAANAVDMGLDIIQALQEYSHSRSFNINMRVGIHTGSVFYGVMGTRRFRFDVWSKDVNIANQIETSGLSGKVVISEATQHLLSGAYLLSEVPRAELSSNLPDQKYFVVLSKRQTHLGNCATWRKKIRIIDTRAVADVGGGAAVQCVEEEGPVVGRVVTCCCPLLFEHRVDNGKIVRSESTNSILDIISKQNQLDQYATLTQANHPFNQHQSAVVTEIMSLLQERDVNFDTFFSTSLHPVFLQFNDQELEVAYRSWGRDLGDCTPGKSPETEFGLVVAKRSFAVDMLLSFLVFVLVSVASFLSTGDSLEERLWWGILLGIGLVIEVSMVLCVMLTMIKRKLPYLLHKISELVVNWKVKTIISLFQIYYPMVFVYVALALCHSSGPGSLAMVAHTEITMYMAVSILVSSVLFMDVSFFAKMIGGVINVVTVVTLAATVQMDQCYEILETEKVFSNTTEATTRPTDVHQMDPIPDEFSVYFRRHVIPLMAILFILLIVLVTIVNRKSEESVRMSFKGRVEAVLQQQEMRSLRHQADWLIHHIIPPHVASELRCKGKYSKNHECVGVIFVTIVNFDEMYNSETNDTTINYMRVLNNIMAEFDELLDKPEFADVDKIKTIGCTYMAVSGLGSEGTAHLVNLINFALQMQWIIQCFNQRFPSFNLQLRIGFNCGPATSGVVGSSKLLFDIWGDTVNIASRMDSTGHTNRIHLPEACTRHLVNYFVFEACGETFVKGKGRMQTVFVKARKRHFLSVMLPDELQATADV